jgi:hypothetical protein
MPRFFPAEHNFESESGGALDHEDFINEARKLEDQARELIAD